jgi:hypothetical protein
VGGIVGGKIDAQRSLAWPCGHPGLVSGRTCQTNLSSGRYHLPELVVQYAMRTTNYSRSHGDISNARLSELVAEIDRMLQEKQGRLIRGIPASTRDAALLNYRRPLLRHQ